LLKHSHVSSHFYFGAINYPLHHRKDIHDDHYLKSHLQIFIFVLFANCIELPLANNWSPWKTRKYNRYLDVQFNPCIHPWKRKKLGSKTLIMCWRQSLKQRNQNWLHEQKKCKPNQNTWNKIGFVVSSFPSPQGNMGSNFIVAEVVTSNEGKGGQGQKPNWPNVNLIFLLFSCQLYFQKFSHYIQVSIMKIEQKSDLKNKF
jgi:hypothetical protein